MKSKERNAEFVLSVTRNIEPV